MDYGTFTRLMARHPCYLPCSATTLVICYPSPLSYLSYLAPINHLFLSSFLFHHASFHTPTWPFIFNLQTTDQPADSVLAHHLGSYHTCSMMSRPESSVSSFQFFFRFPPWWNPSRVLSKPFKMLSSAKALQSLPYDSHSRPTFGTIQAYLIRRTICNA